jgi:arylsulfatase A-like enzyme
MTRVNEARPSPAPTPRLRPFHRGASLGLGVGACWLLFDALYLFVFDHLLVAPLIQWPAPAVVLASYVGLGATLPLALAAWWGAVAWGLERLRSRYPVVQDALRWLVSFLRTRPLDAVAWVIALGTNGALFALGTAVIAVEVFGRVRTPSLAGTATVLGGSLWALALSTTIPAVFAVAQGLVTRLGRGIDGRAAKRVGVLLAVLCPLAAVLAVVNLDDDVRRALPWTYVVSPSLILVAFLAGRRFVRRRVRALKVAGWAGMVVIASLGLLAVWAPKRIRSSLRVAQRQPGISTAWYRAIHRVLDVDRDGALSMFGEGDCAPFNAAIGPAVFDVPNNGVDEDCSGVDAAPLDFEVRSGSKSHSRPSTLRARPNIVLITTDGLTFTETTVGGGAPWVTPRLDAWAQRATVFESAFSSAPTTAESFYSIITGRFAVGASTPETLAVALSGVGYRTRAVLGHRQFDGPPFAKVRAGFERWDTSPQTDAARARGAPSKHSAPEVTQRAIELLQETSDAPLFLWVHYYDQHAPYQPRPTWPAPTTAEDSVRYRYLREVAFADQYWGKLLEAVEARWDADEYVALFTADHGEVFDVHHRHLQHGSSLHTAELNVPLIIQAAQGRGTRTAAMVSLLDIAPTVSNLASAPVHAQWEGESLLRVIFEGAPPEQTVLFASFYGPVFSALSDDPFVAMSVRTNEWYYCRERNGEWLSRWRTDRVDTDVSAANPAMLETLRGVLMKKRGQLLETRR